MRAVFVQLQCQPGKTYEVADALFEREIISELYSTSGEYDLMMKIYIDSEDDIGKFINEQIATVNQRIDGIDSRLTAVEGTAGNALTTAQAASGQSQQNAQRIDQLTGRVDGLDQRLSQQRAPRN